MKQVRVGLIGTGIGQSLTPSMHMHEGAALGLDYRYDLIDLAQPGDWAGSLASQIARARELGFAGLNITHPCKTQAVTLVDELSPEAARLGAINTIVFTENRTIGHNTDMWGFAEGFRRSMAEVARATVLLIGAGGAGVAVSRALVDLGVQNLRVLDQDAAKAEDLVGRMEKQFPQTQFTIVQDAVCGLDGADGLVNATPVGMAKYPGTPLNIVLLHPGLWVADIIYFPIETALLQAARAAGCRTLDGGGMATFQAVRAFELFTGMKPDADRMRTHFLSMIADRS